jgi:hypothetical protein
VGRNKEKQFLPVLVVISYKRGHAFSRDLSRVPDQHPEIQAIEHHDEPDGHQWVRICLRVEGHLDQHLVFNDDVIAELECEKTHNTSQPKAQPQKSSLGEATCVP